MRVRVTRAQPSNDALLGGVDGAVQPAHRVAGLVAGPAPAVGLVVQPQLVSWKTANKHENMRSEGKTHIGSVQI